MSKVLKEMVDILLIIVIVFSLGLVALSLTKKDNTVTKVAGFSVFMVKTGSMATVEPIGSVVIARALPIEAIKQGDDLVFYKNEKTRVTHRVVAIGKDKEGKTILTTKGVNNPKVDEEPVYADNIIGKVRLVIPNLGYLGATLQSQPIYLIIVFAVAILLHFIRELAVKTPEGKEVTG
ncbi:hypothetical protein RyT2_22280 [Pseudolactococcus yaeyamensis]